ncbi:MAG TPA: electron-transfer flavoprotein:ubiquinone oxidoreductase [Methanotrichaceae archaeon]|nr:electron-transfer flavoprotein:ubiquinone oxidoreductase [Methanotrichaceae archaeon]
MDELTKVDVLFIGGGPACLAGAIKLKQLLNQKGLNQSVVIIEKAEKIGQHHLSGAIFQANVLDELSPGWQSYEDDKFIKQLLASQIIEDELYLLRDKSSAFKIPDFLIPSSLHNKSAYAVSISELVNWLAGIATKLGVEIYTGFAAKEVVIENNRVKGIRLGNKGLDKERRPLSNYIPGETIEAKVTVLGEGSAGLLAEHVVRQFKLNANKNPQIYSIGVKEIIRLPENNSFGPNRVIHTLGFPLPSDVYGAGSIYSMRDNLVAVALVMALNWRYADLSPQQELQIFKSHSMIKSFLEGGEVMAYGAKTFPEGGYYSLPQLVADGAMIVGDAAGLTNAKKRKGLHYAIKSGIAAGEAIYLAVEKQDFTAHSLKKYADLLDESFVMNELYSSRNYRQIFSRTGRLGYYLGAPLSFFQSKIPYKLSTKPDHECMRKVHLKRQSSGGIDRLTDVSLSGTMHREDEPSHIAFREECQDKSCFKDFGCYPCASFCPAEVYKFEDDKLILSPSNCLHCQTCRLKCPSQLIRWEVPEGGDGPRYKIM